MDLYQVVHTSPELKTVKEYCAQIDSPAFKYVKRVQDFLSIVGEDKLTNLDRILSSYISVSEKENNPATKQGDLLLKVGTIFYIPVDQVERVGLLTEGIEVTSNNINAFKAQKLVDLESDLRYVKKYLPIGTQVDEGTFKDEYPDATVWLWCRSLSDTFTKAGESAEMTGEIFDITRFVQTLSISNTKNGGNFQITLPPLVCELKIETDSSGRTNSKYVIKKNSIKTYKGGDVNGKDNSYFAEGSIFNENDSYDQRFQKRSSFLFHTIINENDVIFIRFESLDIEEEERLKDRKEFYVDKKNIAGNIYDMIGLVDTNTQTSKSDSNDVTINIEGRDLMKLFIDDGTYFYALENSQGQLKLSGGSTADNELMQRVFSDNSLYYLSLYFNTSIEHILKFIIQQLSNIKVVPDSLLSSYGDRVNTTFSEDNKNLKKTKVKGIWQIVKLVIDEGVSARRLVDASMSSSNGSLLNFIRKACQEPFVEFYTDTYGDEFYLIVRKPPFDKIGVTSAIKGSVITENGIAKTRPVIIDIEPEDTISDSLSYDKDRTYSWYHFTPQNLFLGDASTYSLTLTPALYFKEYAEIWGSKPLEVVHNYTPYYSSAIKETGDLSYYQEQTINDLKYLVESNAYLPFTRKGTIVTSGDRRVKKGNFIRFKATGEIFYVEGVSNKLVVNDNAIDRTTTIEVSRGMVEDFIEGVNINGLRNVSYFNIINTELNFEKRKNIETVFSKFRVNKDIFNFFLRREQFLATNYTKRTDNV